MHAEGGQVHAAYCTDRFLVLSATGAPSWKPNLEDIPMPPSGTDGCRTRTWTSEGRNWAIPLAAGAGAYELLPTAHRSNNNNVEAFPSGGGDGNDNYDNYDNCCSGKTQCTGFDNEIQGLDNSTHQWCCSNCNCEDYRDAECTGCLPAGHGYCTEPGDCCSGHCNSATNKCDLEPDCCSGKNQCTGFVNYDGNAAADGLDHNFTKWCCDGCNCTNYEHADADCNKDFRWRNANSGGSGKNDGNDGNDCCSGKTQCTGFDNEIQGLDSGTHQWCCSNCNCHDYGDVECTDSHNNADNNDGNEGNDCCSGKTQCTGFHNEIQDLNSSTHQWCCSNCNCEDYRDAECTDANSGASGGSGPPTGPGTYSCQFFMEYFLVFNMSSLSASELNCEGNKSRMLIQSMAPHCCSHGGHSICDAAERTDDHGTDDNNGGSPSLETTSAPTTAPPRAPPGPSITSPSSKNSSETLSPSSETLSPSSEDEEFSFDFFLSSGCRIGGGAALHALGFVGAAVALAAVL